ncbi:MAG: hypothetical protein EBX35_10010, partial [Planctomycetia bacterium]|nr:hypothetical protein [Planctomycetia bacterium]
GGFVVNTARHGLVDVPALVAAIDRGEVAGTAFDVFESEPPVDRAAPTRSARPSRRARRRSRPRTPPSAATRLHPPPRPARSPRPAARTGRGGNDPPGRTARCRSRPRRG